MLPLLFQDMEIPMETPKYLLNFFKINSKDSEPAPLTFIKFLQISHTVLVLLLLTLNN